MPMNEAIARAALERMNLREVAVAAHYTGLSADMQFFASADAEEQQEMLSARRDELCSGYGLQQITQNKPFAFSQGVAIIPVHGTLINRFGSSWGYVTGYNFIKQQTALAGVDPDVELIVFDHNSYGGEAAGCFEAASAIKRLAAGKPTLAVVDSNCYSASFALACGCDKIAVTPSGGVGSVGVVAMHVDMSKALEKFGITVTLIHAGDHKVDGNPFEALPANVKADIQTSLSKSYDAFTKHVAEGRGMEVKKVRDTEARIYRADDALDIGFIDAIATPSEAVQAYLGELSGSTTETKKEDSMSATTQDQKQPDAAAQAAAEARTAERARVSGIMGCDEAKGRESLANHLAMNTDMSVDDAKATLSAAPAAAPAAPEAKQNCFKAAMDAGAHPNVGADNAGGAGGGGEQEPAHMAIIRAQQQATGQKLLDK